MSDASSYMNGPAYYSLSLVLWGIALVMTAGAIIGAIFFVTRRKKIKSLASLKIIEKKPIDLDALKTKYLGLIDQAERNYNDHKIKSSVAHQHFSLTVRLFYAEALGFHANILTLSDLKKTNYTMLIETIEKLYPDEFNTLEKGSVATAAENARRLVRNQ